VLLGACGLWVQVLRCVFKLKHLTKLVNQALK